MTTTVSTVMNYLTAMYTIPHRLSQQEFLLPLLHTPFLSSLFLVFFSVDPTDLKFLIPLPQPPQLWDYKSVPPGLLQSTSG